jgi:hypothetical protein
MEFKNLDYEEALDLFKKLTVIVSGLSRGVDFFYKINIRNHSTKFGDGMREFHGPWIVFSAETFDTRPSNSAEFFDRYIKGKAETVLRKKYKELKSNQPHQINDPNSTPVQTSMQRQHVCIQSASINNSKGNHIVNIYVHTFSLFMGGWSKNSFGGGKE